MYHVFLSLLASFSPCPPSAFSPVISKSRGNEVALHEKVQVTFRLEPFLCQAVRVTPRWVPWGEKNVSLGQVSRALSWRDPTWPVHSVPCPAPLAAGPKKGSRYKRRVSCPNMGPKILLSKLCTGAVCGESLFSAKTVDCPPNCIGTRQTYLLSQHASGDVYLAVYTTQFLF